MFLTKKDNVHSPIEKYSISDDDIKQLFNMGKTEAGYLKKIEPIIIQNGSTIAEKFYSQITAVPEINKFIATHSTLAHLKQTFLEFLPMMYEINIDKQYISRIKKIGEIHNTIKLPAEWFSMSFGVLEQNIYPYIFAKYKDDTDILMNICIALSHHTQFIQALVMRTFVDEYISELKNKEKTEASLLVSQKELLIHIQEMSESLAAMSQEMTASTESIVSTVMNIEHSAGSVKDQADKTNLLAVDGESTIRKIIDDMNVLTDQIKVMKNSLEGLSESTESVNKITETISDIAAQTNLLALNAAIEAARAGVAGRGFAVVAEEVRKLADQSREAASGIHEIILQNTNSTDVVFDNMNKQGTILEKIVEDISKSMSGMTEITHATEENHKQVSAIDNSLITLSTNTRDLEQVSEEVSKSATDLFQRAKKVDLNNCCEAIL